MNRVPGLCVLILLFLAGCGSAPVATESTGPSMKFDFNAQTDFRLYKSYRWFDGPFLPGDPATRDESQYKTVRDAVNVVMKENGYDWLQFSPTDLVLNIHSGFDVPENLDAWITYNWYKPWWGAFGPFVDVSHYEKGTLVVDVIDAKRTELLWRGMLPAFYSPSGGLTDVEGFAVRLASLLENLPTPVR
jgi:hypothetical protein